MADRTRTGRIVVVVVLVAAVSVGGTVAVMRARDAGAQPPPAGVATGTAQVIRTDLSTTTQVDGTLGYAGSYTVVGQTDGIYTALPAVGAVLSRGDVAYEVDGRAVYAWYGTRPEWRTLRLGVPDGPDVLQLKENLRALGFTHAAFVVNAHFDSATDAAVRRWQASVGEPITGIVGVGDIAYVPTRIRVTAVQADLGSPAHAGSALLTATTTDRVVDLSLPVAQEYLLKAGDPVTVTMPDGTTTANGTVTAVSSVAGNGSASSGGSAPPSAGNGPLFVDVTVRLGDAAAAGNLDQAPVTVNITDQSVHDVLAVPINALVALAEGGYAVDVVDPGHATRLVAVHTGLFSDSLVEVSGAGLAAGTTVAVPAS